MGTTLQAGRILVLVGLLLAVESLWPRWSTAVRLLEYPALRWTWLALAALALAFLTVALLARGRRQPPWLLAAEGLVAAITAVVFLVPGALGRSGLVEGVAPLAEFVNDMALIQGTTWYLRVLVLIWLVIVADAAVRQVRGSAPHRGGSAA